MKIETYKIDNVNTRGLNPNTKGDEEFDLGNGPGWGSAMIMMGEKYPHESLQYKVQTWYNQVKVIGMNMVLNQIMKIIRKQLICLFMVIGRIPKMELGIIHT
ncbi:MAG: hypothetical protein EP145_12180 [Bacteroides uniformis]|nr:hypothetical protein [Bacteroides uniformis]